MPEQLPPAPRRPAGHSPLRRPNSVRRTSSIDMCWPQGMGKPARFAGRARDVYTGPDGGAPIPIAEDALEADVAPDRTVLAIETRPARAQAAGLVGARGGDYLRKVLNERLPAEREAGTALYLLIDDLSGASLVSGWAWSRWTDRWMQRAHEYKSADEERAARRSRMESVCIGFRPGSSALTDLHGADQNHAPVLPLPNPDDPQGWHAFTENEGVSMRRARRIDLWRDGAMVRIDATFQDSASVPEGGRVAIHEYLLDVRVDAATMTVASVTPDPRILPYRECPSAVGNVGRLVGTPVRDLRNTVLVELRRVLGCTHLNDALRALAEVPLLLAHLDRLGPAA